MASVTDKRVHEASGAAGRVLEYPRQRQVLLDDVLCREVCRVVPGDSTFLWVMDREDLDDQIWRTFIGCGVSEEDARAGSGRELGEIRKATTASCSA